MQKKNLKAFSLVELLVVIGIIGILSTVGIISYNGTQKVARDNQRKSDLQAIGTAYKMHYQDKKAWSFNAAELSGINPTATSEGNGGQGWFNYQTGSYKVSMANALTTLGYLTKAPRDPLIPDDSTFYLSAKASQYLKYFCTISGSTKGIILFSRLENSTSVATPFYDADSSLNTLCTNFDSLKTTLAAYKINYAILVK